MTALTGEPEPAQPAGPPDTAPDVPVPPDRTSGRYVCPCGSSYIHGGARPDPHVFGPWRARHAAHEDHHDSPTDPTGSRTR
ncbi:hypothetical protein [Oerskovia jenensis]|uniref:hypothetical protein n=1 Tax=Oerskovia jenensis TaxID=162169 RepID=UPI0036DA22BD